MFRASHKGLKNIPDQGGAILVCNSANIIDALIIARVCRRPVRFILPASNNNIPILNFIFRIGKAIFIDFNNESSAGNKQSLIEISSALKSGEVVCFFVKGEFSKNKKLEELVVKSISQNKEPLISIKLRKIPRNVQLIVKKIELEFDMVLDNDLQQTNKK